MTGESHMSQVSGGATSRTPSQTWQRHLSSTSSEGERLMFEALVESSHGGRHAVLQYIKMLSVVALPVVAVICLVSYTLHIRRVEQAGSVISFDVLLVAAAVRW